MANLYQMIISSSREFSHYINNNYPKKEKEKKGKV